MTDKTRREDWWKVALREGRVCRLCFQPIPKADWRDKLLDHLCFRCFFSESQIPHSTAWRLGRR